MSDFEIRGRVIGDKQVRRMLNTSPKVYSKYVRDWFEDERARILGGGYKNSKGKQKYRGFRDRLSRKKGYSGSTWDRRVAHLFKGSIPFTKKLDNMHLIMGVLGKNKLQKALRFMGTGGSISSSKEMPVPIWENLKRDYNNQALQVGSAKTGLKSKLFSRLLSEDKLVRIKRGRTALYFDKKEQKVRGGFLKRGLLFVGKHNITISPQFTGKYNFDNYFGSKKQQIMTRGRKIIDRATKKSVRINR